MDIIAIITTILAGFTANYLIERYKELKKIDKNYKSLTQNLHFFIELTRNAMNIRIGSKPQKELDENAGIRNLGNTFQFDNIYQDLIKKLLFYNSSNLKDKDYTKVEEVKKHIRNIQLIILKIDTKAPYSSEYFNYNLRQFEVVNNEIFGIEKLISEIQVKKVKKNNLIKKWLKELLYLIIGALVGYFIVSYVNLPQNFFSNLVSLNGTFLMGIGAILLAILSLFQKKGLEDLKSHIINFITVEYPTFFFINIMLLTIGTRVEIFDSSLTNELFWAHYDKIIQGFGLFITVYILFRVTMLFNNLFKALK